MSLRQKARRIVHFPDQSLTTWVKAQKLPQVAFIGRYNISVPCCLNGRDKASVTQHHASASALIVLYIFQEQQIAFSLQSHETATSINCHQVTHFYYKLSCSISSDAD